MEVPLNNLYQDVSGYLSTPSDEGNYAYKVGTGGYAAEISNGIIKAVGHIASEVTTQYIIRYIPDTERPEVYDKGFPQDQGDRAEPADGQDPVPHRVLS